ncbi:MAG: HEAT repeat domain-containing protein [Planctomycetaceae bacterium]|nr:HEAT repeat domain-containing protein [Planctomycetaceae bacterium]
MPLRPGSQSLRNTTAGLAGWLLLGCATLAHGDLIKLKSGGELRGKIVKTAATDSVTLESIAGATIVVPADDVQFVTRRPAIVEEYEVRARRADDTIDGQWELAKWCKDRKLTTERTIHLQRVVELDPDHKPAHVALGHVWKEGAWVDWDQYMATRGFVKYKGKFVTQQELDLLKKSADELKREQEWYPKIRLWAGWITGPHAERRQNGLTALQAVDDADAAPAVLRFLGNHPAKDVRLLGVAILSHSDGEKSASSLVKLALRDEDGDVRSAAMQGIPESQFDRIRPLFIKELRSESNPVVCRAATALARLGNEDAVAPLIEALITAHHYEVRLPIGQTYSFGTDGSYGGQSGALPPDVEAALRTGQLPMGVVMHTPTDPAKMRTVVVRKEHQNAEALAALQTLTGEDYGYDERTWRLWWAAKKHDGGTLSKS